MKNKKIIPLILVLLLGLTGCKQGRQESDVNKKGALTQPEYITKLESDETSVSNIVNNISCISYNLPDNYEITKERQKSIIQTPNGEIVVLYCYDTAETALDIYNACACIIKDEYSSYVPVSYYHAEINKTDAIFAEYRESDDLDNEKAIMLSIKMDDTPFSLFSTSIDSYEELYDLTKYMSFHNQNSLHEELEMEMGLHEQDENIKLEYFYPISWRIAIRDNLTAYKCMNGGHLDNCCIVISKNSPSIDKELIDYEINLNYSDIYAACYSGTGTDSVNFIQNKTYFLREYICQDLEITVTEDFNRREECINNINMLHTNCIIEAKPRTGYGYGEIPSFGRFINCETYYFLKAGENYQISFLYPDKEQEGITFIINTFFSKLY